MLKWIKRALALFGLALVVVLGGALAFFWTPDTDAAEMRAKYGAGGAFAPVSEGYAIHYRDQGCADCPALMLIHGTSASLHTWEPMVARLGDQFRIVTLDLPGHGLTGPHPAGDYSQASADEAINAVVAATGLTAFAIGGNSLGGGVAWRYALDHPVRALVLLDPTGAPRAAKEAPPPSNIGFRLLQTPVVSELTTVVTPRALVKKSLRQSVSNQAIVTPEAVDRYWELLRYPGNRRALIDRARTRSGPPSPEFDRLGSLQTPTLIIWGAEDTLIPVERAPLFVEAMPDAALIIYERIGHLPMEEAADRTSRDVAAFLRLH